MKVIVDDLNFFLNTCIKPIINFTTRSSLVPPSIKLVAEKKKLKITCVGNDRKSVIFPNAKVVTQGKCIIPASSIMGIRSSQKKAVLVLEKGKLFIKGGDKNRKLILSLDLIDKVPTLNIKATKKQKNVGNADLGLINDILASLSITPITTPDYKHTIICFHKEKGQIVVYVNDALRILKFIQKKSELKFKEDLITDFVELRHITSLVSSISATAAFKYTNKYISVIGYDEKSKEEVNILLNHSLPKSDPLERVEILTKGLEKEKPIMTIKVVDDFKELLENVIPLASARKEGYFDIELKKGKVTVSGSGPSTNHKESLKLSKKTFKGGGKVRINANVFSDMLKFLSESSLIKVTKRSVIIINKLEEKAKTIFFLPHQSLEG